jgi:hypothetical protein
VKKSDKSSPALNLSSTSCAVNLLLAINALPIAAESYSNPLGIIRE